MPGYHLIAEGVIGTHHDGEALCKFIRNIADSIDMTVVVGPHWEPCLAHITAWAVIAESHIVVAEWDNGEFVLHVFSCKDFKVTIPVDMALETMDMQPGYVMRVLPRAGTS